MTIIRRVFYNPIMNNPEFRAAVQRPDEEIDLAQAALLFARDAYPDLDPYWYVNQLNEWADAIRSAVEGATDPLEPLHVFLFEQLNFIGNRISYNDPANSYLNKAIDRRVGLPITLSVIYLEIARRLNLAVDGIGLPGHFIVRYATGSDVRYIDPFYRGRVLTEDDCRNLVVDLSNGALEFQPAMLEPVDARHILTRMLSNLKNAYVQEQQFDRAVPVVERLLDHHEIEFIQFRE